MGYECSIMMTMLLKALVSHPLIGLQREYLPEVCWETGQIPYLLMIINICKYISVSLLGAPG